MDGVSRLAEEAARGDRDALAAFVHRTQADVWRLCAHLVDRDSADDLTQETFLRAIKALRGYRGEASGRTFVLAIARRTCMDELRRRTRRRRLGTRVRSEAEVGDVLEADPSGMVALDELVEALDPDRREAFVLTQLLGLGYAEAAEVCGCPVGTIRSRVARARADLLEAVGEAESGDDASGSAG